MPASMADYYPLLSRALEALSDTSPGMRRAVYERARSALTEQLRSVDPPLSEADITRERLSLDGAISRIEAEWARRAPAAAAGPATPSARPREAPRPAPSLPDVENPAPVQRAVAREPDLPPAEDLDAVARPEPPPRERPRIETIPPRVAQAGHGRSMILGGVLFAVIGLIAIAAWLLRDAPPEAPPEPPVAAAPPPAPVEGERKIAERVGGERAPPPAAQAPAASAPAAPGDAAAPPRVDIPVAQRALLYEENPEKPSAPKIAPGRAVWRLDNVNAGQGQPLETVVRATVEVPSVGLTLNLVLRRNLDPTLPASHTVELAFITAPGEGRAVRDVGVLQFKTDENERGTPISGLPVPVRENLFLIGLSNLPADVERNTDLLQRRNWIDLPVRFASGQRAILSFEKGLSGEQVIAEAFRQWQ
jgi:hypothetical protein